MVKFISSLFVLSIFTFLMLPVAGVFLMVEDEPLVANAVNLTHDDIARAQKLLKENDPRQMQNNSIISLVLSEDELNLMLNYAIEKLAQGAARLDLHNANAELNMTLILPQNPIGEYANISMALSQLAGGLCPSKVKIGSVNFPDFLLSLSFNLAKKFLNKNDLYIAVSESINGLRLSENQVNILYQWRPEIIGSIKQKSADLLVSDAEKERLLAYAQKIAQVSNSTFSKRISVTEILEPVFNLAKTRSISKRAVDENRSALTAIFFYMNGVGVGRLLNAPNPDLYKMTPRQLTLQGRDDFAQHFLISAGITAGAGGHLADAIGLFKEVDDSKGGSGFSFNDLAMDWAGTSLAQKATDSEEKARFIQNLLSNGVKEEYFIPATNDLPEFLQENDFIRQYGGINAPAYNEMTAKIKDRINALKIHQ